MSPRARNPIDEAAARVLARRESATEPQADRFTDAEHAHHEKVAHHWTGGDEGAKHIVLKAWKHIHDKHGASKVRSLKSYQAATKHYVDHPPGEHPHNFPHRESTDTASAEIGPLDMVAHDLGDPRGYTEIAPEAS